MTQKIKHITDLNLVHPPIYMQQFNSRLRDVSWDLDRHPSTAGIFNSSSILIPSTSEITNHTLHAGRIALLYEGDRPILTTPFRGGSFRKWMRSLHAGLHKKITVSELSRSELCDMYIYIAGFAREYRAALITKLETDNLRAVDILRDHKYFEGGLALKRRIWMYKSALDRAILDGVKR